MTTIVVEDGSIIVGANSYVSEADLVTFATARGITLTSDEDELIIQAMDYIESLGYKGIKRTRDQSLQWPRIGVIIDGYYFDSDDIPQQLIDGLCQTAIAIDQGNNPLIDSPRKTVRERVGDLEVEYAQGASSVIVNKKILNTLNKLLGNGVGANTIKVGKG